MADGTRTDPRDLLKVTVIHHEGRYYLNEGSNFYGPDHGLYRQTEYFRQCVFYDADQEMAK